MHQDIVDAMKKMPVQFLVDGVLRQKTNENDNTMFRGKKELNSFLYSNFNEEEEDEDEDNKIFKQKRSLTGLEKLLHEIFIANKYNRYVRPVDELGITNIQTQLKLLQIDLVKIY